jgi:DNA polymerase type B, organellar and viral
MDTMSNTTNYLKHKLFGSGESDVTLINTSYDKKGRYFTFTLTNNYLLDNKQILRAMFDFMMSNPKFTEFGNNKIIIVKAIINQNLSYSLHHNILLNNKTTFNEYYGKVKDHINNHYSNLAYQTDTIPQFEILVWNVDDLRNKHIQITKSTLSPYKLKEINKNYGLLKSKQSLISRLNTRSYHSNSIKPIKATTPVLPNDFAAMDIETVVFNNKQVPIAISIVSEDDRQLFILRKPDTLDIVSVNKAVEELWTDFFAYIITNNHLFKAIFLHNLGSFDGYFIYKTLSTFFEPNQISTIIDHHNKFIKITLKLDSREVVFLDSLRIFPVSLEDLCKNFNVKGKVSKYNQDFIHFDLFDNEYLFNLFKQYSLQDSVALFDPLMEAQKLYISLYNVDITTILSTSTLSLKIFRQNFLKTEIPILKGTEDSFIRRSYFGGHTDYYQEYAENLHYYDINSLYPFAMCKPMPHKLEKLKESHQYSYFLPFILSKVGGNISEESESIIRYAFSMFTLNLIVLICFTNVFGYILSLYLISKYDIETKFPKLKRIIKYYDKSTQFFIIIEVLTGIIFLIVTIIMNLILCGVIILK